MENEVRFVIVDDQEGTRQRLRALLESRSGWKVVAEAGDGDLAIQTVNNIKPDILLTDVQHPGPNGLEITRWVTKNIPGVRVLIVTLHANKPLVREILESGGRGYVMKTDADRELIPAVEAVLEGKLFFTMSISEVSLSGFLEKDQPAGPENMLTKREVEIVVLLARGKSNKEVATELKISLRAAETHRAILMNKLQLHSLQDLARYAVKNRMLDV